MAVLTPKQQRFATEYLTDLNATQAAIRAGFSSRSANQQAVRLMRNPLVQAAIQAARADQQRRTEITADRVLLELARVAFSDVGHVLDFATDADTPRLRRVSEITEEARRAIASVKVRRYMEGSGDDAREVEVTEFKLWDKLGALAKLAAHLGLGEPKAPLKVDVTSGGKPIESIAGRIDALAAAFEGAADRQGEGGPAGDSPGEPLDS